MTALSQSTAKKDVGSQSITDLHASQGFLCLHQGHRGQAWTHCLGGQDAFWGGAAGA